MSNFSDQERYCADMLTVFSAALTAVRGGQCARDFLAANPLRGDVFAVAVGKAATAMMEGASAALGRQLRAGLVITKDGYDRGARLDAAKVQMMAAGHPLPDERSLAAGQALLKFIADAPRSAHLVFLISGGTSSLADVLPSPVSLRDLRRATAWLLASGLDIHAVNAVRRRLSLIKSGRLAEHLQGRAATCLLISDVPGDDPADIGSGLLVPEPDESIVPEVPAWLGSLLEAAPLLPATTSPCFATVQTHIIATPAAAMEAAAHCARSLGYMVTLHEARLSGDAAAAGRQCAKMLLQGAPGMHLWGGETTVQLPPEPGRGGRNQTLALAAATVLAGHDNVYLLALATDGSDGPGGDAGGLVDGGTLARGRVDDLDAEASLRRADAGTFLEASGDLVSTGPTGTNVMDMVIGLKA